MTWGRRSPEWRDVVRMAGATPRHIVDAQGTRWEVWFQNQSSPKWDTVRFYAPDGECRLGGVPTGTFRTITDEALGRLLLEAHSLRRPTGASSGP